VSCVVDTDVVIAAVDRGDAHHDDAARAVRALARAEVPLLVSLVNDAELLVQPAKNRRTLQAAIDAIDAMGIKPMAPTPAVAREAARLRHLNISLPEGFALATARAHRASIATFDRRLRRSLDAVRVELAPGFD
jgi:predicted nucleic acid-binding protein